MFPNIIELNMAYELNKAEPADTTTKYVIVNEKLVRFINCVNVSDGKLTDGTRDKSFSLVTENQEN